ncbi:hypothetical protein BCR39DRAFT_511548 [Naematelia encephala]|uniref:Single hybrid motif-containing protein n=1 Tax=Naematelia encephala TaxID=71784 RepID=A0A1Y2BLP3_9TREE|nr:hypothetical protein BCR39DRAFT_511548 [Naematelia encephala]
MATTAMRMPAMSPTMTEGGIAGWKKAEGESFAAGDVLLEVETDKATIDVEAADDGVMGKIIVQDGASKIPVGQVIALLAEEGDDLSAIEIPKDLSPPTEDQPPPRKDESSATTQNTQAAPEPKKEESPVEHKDAGHKEIKHPQPLFPSVSRLLLESDLSSEEIYKLKGSGLHGMLTKGDVLKAMGKIQNVWGSAEKLNLDILGPSGRRQSESAATTPTEPAKQVKEEPLDGPALRRLILAGMSKATEPAKPIVPHTTSPLPLSPDAEFDSILSPYSTLLPSPQPSVSIPGPDALKAMEGKGPSTKKDEWAGLF